MATVEDKKTILSFLEKNPVGTLATVTPENIPTCTPIYFIVKPDFTIYFITKYLTKKVTNLIERPAVSLVTFSEEQLTSVELKGNARVVHEPIEFAQTMELFETLVEKRKSGLIPPIAQIKAGKYVAVRFRPKEICYRKFQSTTADSDRCEIILSPQRQGLSNPCA